MKESALDYIGHACPSFTVNLVVIGLAAFALGILATLEYQDRTRAK